MKMDHGTNTTEKKIKKTEINGGNMTDISIFLIAGFIFGCIVGFSIRCMI